MLKACVSLSSVAANKYPTPPTRRHHYHRGEQPGGGQRGAAAAAIEWSRSMDINKSVDSDDDGCVVCDEEEED